MEHVHPLQRHLGKAVDITRGNLPGYTDTFKASTLVEGIYPPMDNMERTNKENRRIKRVL
ncbi:hypothetical protein [Parasphaerochaeta coccoides]|uniref:hypothetical protein n=1 Tax=Parasphaerochaeta coccoides TaxID=273376 RepID=UPI00145F966F|nr:hypothetical protein [Parasphaerochaeta coccoides]